jgi:ketosteroid isomerase-like protein
MASPPSSRESLTVVGAIIPEMRNHAETVRAIYERWCEGDFTAGEDLYDDATAFVLNPEFPDAGVYIGAGQVRTYMSNFLEPWQRLTISCSKLEEHGDTVLAEVRQEGEGTLSGAMTGFDYFQVWTFRGGTLVRLENFMHRAQVDHALRRDG